MSQWSPRTQKRLWIAAATVSAVPPVWGLASSLFGESSKLAVGSGIFGTGQCQGWLHHYDLWSVPGYDLLHYRPWTIVLPAFVLWLFVRRRAVGWTAVALLAPLLLAEPALFGYDVARWGRTCVELWYSFGAGQAVWQVYDLLPLALVLAATYRPGRTVVRTAAALVLLGPLLATAGDREAAVTLSSPEACEDAEGTFQWREDTSARSVAGMSERERKLTYLCRIRGYSSVYPGSPPLGSDDAQAPSDSVLLHEGRRACRGERLRPRPGSRTPSLHDYVYLCPDVALAEQRALKRALAESHEEYEREQARKRAYCKRRMPDANVRPVLEHTDVMTGGMTQSYQVGELAEGASFDGYPADELVVARDGLAAVSTGTEDGFCLTVRAYRHEPPPDLDGWDRVVEVGFDSPDGETTLVQPDGPSEVPPFTVAGPGRYRLRLHVSGQDEPDSWERPSRRHLLVVYPGESEKVKVLE